MATVLHPTALERRPPRRASSPAVLRGTPSGIRVTTRRVQLALAPTESVPPVGQVVDHAADAAAVARAAIGAEITECVIVLFLDARNRVTGYSEVARGTLNAARMSARDVLLPALYANAHSIVLAHNHPSGDCAPSFADRAVTRTLREAAQMVGIVLTDHLIVTPSRHHSFAAEDDWSTGSDTAAAGR